jgi:tetratricopeptide (TPR) repeat protein
MSGKTASSTARVQSTLQQGMALFQKGRLQDAERVFQSALAIDSKNINALQLLGIIQFQTGRFKDGEQLLRRAIKQKPNIADLHYNLGNMLDQQGKFEQAVVAYKNAIKLGMNSDQTHNNLGMVQSKLGQLEEAELSLRKAVDINPKNPSALSNYGLVLSKNNRVEDALKMLEQAIDIEPRFVDAISNIGGIYFEKNDLARAEEYLRQALEVDAKNANVMNSLAGVLLRKGEDDAALVMIQDAVNLNPESIDISLNLAKVLLSKEDYEGALDAFRHLLKASPRNSQALVGIGGILSKQGKFEGAKEYFLKALQAEPTMIGARVGLIDIDPPGIEDSEVKKLESVYGGDSVSEEDKTGIAFCLAKTYEKDGQYRDGFSYLSDGNRLKRSGYEYSLEEDRNFFGKIKDIFSKGFFQEHSGSGFDDKTPIFILGMPRSGTTLTEQIISSHPQVYGAGELPDLRKIVLERCGGEEYESFPELIGRLGRNDIAQMGKDYISGLRERDNSAERITDKMPHNFLHVGMIHLMLPNAKIIHCKRDPIDNCLSIFKQNFVGSHKYAYEQSELGGYYLLYQELMQHWHEVLPGFMFDLQYEDMVADQEGMTRQLLEYCDLPWDDSCLQFHKSERVVKTASYTQVRKKIYSDSVQLWKRYEQDLQPLINALTG